MSSEKDVFMSGSQENVHKSIINFLKQKNLKVTDSVPFSSIRAEIGFLNSLSLSQAKGNVEIILARKEDGCNVSFRFNFLKDYVADMIVTAIGEILFLYILLWSISTNFYQTNFYIAVLIALPIFVIILAEYSTSLTKKKFMEEFVRFTNDLSKRKE